MPILPGSSPRTFSADDALLFRRQRGARLRETRLYRVVYDQTSPYVHGSAWSLRAVGAFTTRGYDAERALIDTATLIRGTLVVWSEWTAFCDRELGWTLGAHLAALKERLDELQEALDAKTAGDDAAG